MDGLRPAFDWTLHAKAKTSAQLRLEKGFEERTE